MHMNAEMHLANHFLIAMPQLVDPNFNRTLTLVCEHDRNGAMGLVVNRSQEIRLGQLLEHVGIQTEIDSLKRQPVSSGGPVEKERGFVLHRPLGQWESTLAISDTLGLTTSRDILEALARGAENAPTDVMVLLGYAGWAPGQLEAEVGENAWLTLPASENILFDTALPERWQTAAARLGVDLGLLSTETGHA